MKIEPDDPILTAYALSELDEASFAAVEEALKNSPEAQQAVDEILRTSAALGQDLAAEPVPGLTELQRAAVEAASVRRPRNVVGFPWRRVVQTSALAAAACLALALVVASLWTKPTPMRTKTAQVRPAPVVPVEPPAGEETKDMLAKVESPAITQAPEPQRNAPQPGGPPVTVPRMDPRLAARYGLIAPSPSAGDQSAPRGDIEAIEPPPMQEPPPVQRFPEVAMRRYAGRYTDRYGGMPAPAAARRDLGGTVDSASTLERRRYSYSPPDSRESKVSTGPGTAAYPSYIENEFRSVSEHPLSTFGVDVDTAAYAQVRHFLNQNQLPPHDAVRVEELVNYFPYQYAAPRGNEPFSVQLEAAGCPWNPEHRLVRIGLQGRSVQTAERVSCNLVFLIDVSGSMQPADRLPLIKQALRVLARKMNESDRIAIVAYAGRSRLVLPSTSCEQKEKILAAIDDLQAGGTTNGGDGLQQAFRVAADGFMRGGVNRVILCTDGDFNVGVTSQGQLVDLVQEKARSGVFLTALGVGQDNYKDALMQRIADRGNGNYHYLDTLEEAQKVLLEQMNANLVTVAKDVKVQVEFNPAQVRSYRLIGYEKRLLRAKDFNDDHKDAGEVGAGHAVTAFYEVVPAAGPFEVEPRRLRYQRPVRPVLSEELLTLKLRYQEPSGSASRLLEFPFADNGQAFANASTDFRFAAAVATFGMLLKNSAASGQSTFDSVLSVAEQSKGPDENGYRAEFINLVRKAKELTEGARRHGLE